MVMLLRRICRKAHLPPSRFVMLSTRGQMHDQHTHDPGRLRHHLFLTGCLCRLPSSTRCTSRRAPSVARAAA